MEDFLYILAVLAWVAYSFYKNSKKVKERRPQVSREPMRNQEEEEEKEYPEIRNVLRNLLGDDFESAAPPQRKHVEMAGVPEIRMAELEGEIYPDEGSKQMRFTSDLIDMDKGLSAEILGEEDDKVRKRTAFDLRTAIVMSEILNRPYDETKQERLF